MTHSPKSPLRYPGGKSRAISAIMSLLPARISEYREPFLGGGSVFIAVKRLFGKHIARYWVNDLNADLICLWQQAQHNMPALLARIHHLKQSYPDGHTLYRALRTLDDATASDLTRAARFFVLNRITFSGVADAGGYSEQAFKGRFTNSAIARLAQIETLLSGVRITQGDYEPLLTQDGEEVFIFLDPPYLSATSSRLYGKRGVLHVGFDHERFAQLMQQCPHKWLITYDDCPEVRALFRFADISTWQLQYGMNNVKRAAASKGNELFIKNF